MKQPLLQTLLLLAAAGISSAASAQAISKEPAYPTKPIRMVVPFTPGSATDIIARIIGPKLAEKLGQQIVVDTRPSAGGIVAFNIVAEATPDGHTLTTTGSNFAGSAALYAAKLPYDSVRDFAGITQIATTPLILVVASSLGAKSVKELIALAKQKPGQLNFGSSGIGSGPHYGAALFQLAAGINVVHVPYRGSPEAFNDMIAGRLDYFLSPIMAAVPFIKSGRVLALGVTTAQRALPMPDVPTIAEAGLAGFEYEGWYSSRRARHRARSSTCSQAKSAASSNSPTSRSGSRAWEPPPSGARPKSSTSSFATRSGCGPRCGRPPASKLNERMALTISMRVSPPPALPISRLNARKKGNQSDTPHPEFCIVEYRYYPS